MMRFRKSKEKLTKKNERPVDVEVWVFKERWKESVYKGTSESDVGVMTVVGCVYSYGREEIFQR